MTDIIQTPALDEDFSKKIIELFDILNEYKKIDNQTSNDRAFSLCVNVMYPLFKCVGKDQQLNFLRGFELALRDVEKMELKTQEKEEENVNTH